MHSTPEPGTLTTIQLPPPVDDHGTSVFVALKRRRTTRDIGSTALPQQVLANLLWAACGVNRRTGPFGVPGRTAASASNSQEIDLYVALKDGAYLYDAAANLLKPIIAGDLRTAALTPGQRAVSTDAPVQLIYVADLQRLIHTQGFQEPGLKDPEVQKSYYYVDTGLIAGNVYLFAAAHGLAAWFHNCDKAGPCPAPQIAEGAAGALRSVHRLSRQGKRRGGTMNLSGNTVLITGGASGIGYAMAEAFLDAGSTVVICGRNSQRLLEARAKHPELHTRVCDVSREEDRQQLLEWASTHVPSLNVLVNNAGVQRDIDFTHGIEEFAAGENEIRINLESPIILCGLFVPLLTRNKDAAIINISSGLGFVPAARMPVYSATKAGMHAFSMALRHQLSKVGVKVFEIVPPTVDTGLNASGRAKRQDFRANLAPKEFVSAVMRGLEKDTLEIGYGMTAGLVGASRADLDKRFQEMNSRI